MASKRTTTEEDLPSAKRCRSYTTRARNTNIGATDLFYQSTVSLNEEEAAVKELTEKDFPSIDNDDKAEILSLIARGIEASWSAKDAVLGGHHSRLMRTNMEEELDKSMTDQIRYNSDLVAQWETINNLVQSIWRTKLEILVDSERESRDDETRDGTLRNRLAMNKVHQAFHLRQVYSYYGLCVINHRLKGQESPTMNAIRSTMEKVHRLRHVLGPEGCRRVAMYAAETFEEMQAHIFRKKFPPVTIRNWDAIYAAMHERFPTRMKALEGDFLASDAD